MKESSTAIIGKIGAGALFFLLVSLLWVISSEACEYRGAGPSLGWLVENSETVVLGTVVSRKKTVETVQIGKREWPYYKTKIRVEQVLKGDPELRQVAIKNIGTSCHAGGIAGHKGVYFLATQEDGNLDTVSGKIGAISVVGDQVVVWYIDGQSKQQELKQFLSKIIDALKANS
jgi:hypothetical protein